MFMLTSVHSHVFSTQDEAVLKGSLSVATLAVAGFAKEYLSLATWGVEGAKNPIGITTGGKGAAVKGTEPRSLSLLGKGTEPSRLKGGYSSSRLKVGSNTSLIGVGLTAHHRAGVDVQNLKITHIGDNDCRTIRKITHILVDHNEFASDIKQHSDHNEFFHWNYFHDHWKSSLVGNDFRDLDFGHLHVYHHNMGTWEPAGRFAGRFGHQHIYNNLLYEDFHSVPDIQVDLITIGMSHKDCLKKDFVD
ncbi:hypothetical protein CEK25_012171 [Fusarium fujikuroi]|nr:hypothetical protein CEK25_012171 [Fusarium fujikuroi]